VVNPKVIPVSTLQELIGYARKHPLMYATSSNGSMGHLSFELIAQSAGITVQHVPYKGGAPALTDLLGGQVPMMYADIRTVLPHIRSGKLKALAVGNPTRIPALPDVPTVAESGFPGFVGTAWGGLMAPAKTQANTLSELSEAIAKTLRSPDVVSKIAELGAEAAPPMPASDFGKFMTAESEKWTAIIRSRGIRAE
jgi:tripartite-type tricarboxylate transporter receptor subunit TctC